MPNHHKAENFEPRNLEHVPTIRGSTFSVAMISIGNRPFRQLKSETGESGLFW